MGRSRLTVVALLAGLVPLGIPCVASGQPTDPDRAAAAQAIYDEATKLLEARDYARACPKLEEVTKLVPEGLGAKLSLAECYEGAGKLASAWTLYKLVEGAASAAGQRERSDAAAKKVDALAPRLAKLVVTVPPQWSGLDGLTISRDGREMSRAQWGVPIPIDVGTYRLTATAKGKKPWSLEVRVERDGAVVTQPIGPLEDDKGAPVAGPTGAQARPADETVTVSSDSSDGLGGQRIAGIVVGGAGVVGLAIGAAFGGVAIGKQGDSNEPGFCDASNRCTQAGLDLRQEALTASYVSTAMLVVGGALTATGVVVFLTAPRRDPKPGAVGLRIMPGALAFVGGFQ